MSTIQELEARLRRLEGMQSNYTKQMDQLLVSSRRAVEQALHAYKVDHGGYIWVYSPDDGLYHKTNMRVCTPEIADRAVQTRHLVARCITSEKIADGAITSDKLDDEVINELRMLDLHDVLLGEYYTKTDIDEKLQGLGYGNVPTRTSQLTNDSGFVNRTELEDYVMQLIQQANAPAVEPEPTTEPTEEPEPTTEPTEETTE